jgi:hypothetical protein
MNSVKAEEDLAFMRRVIENSRVNVEEDLFYYLYWGITIVLGTAVSYLLGYLDLPGIILPFWLAVLSGSFIYILLRERRRSSQRRAETHLEKVYGSVWTGFMLLIGFFFLFAFLHGSFSVSILLGFIALMLGFVFWINSFLLQVRYLRILSLLWWISVTGFALVPAYWAPAFMGGCVVVLEIVPAMVLTWKRRHAG